MESVWSTMTEPTDAFSADDFVDEAVGIFMDPNHYKGAASFAGLRFIAIFPSQTIQMVGSMTATQQSCGSWTVTGQAIPRIR